MNIKLNIIYANKNMIEISHSSKVNLEKQIKIKKEE